MQESDTFLMILEEGVEKAPRKAVLVVGEARLPPADEAVRSQLASITDLGRLERMLRQAAKATSWQEILATP
jgi:hypothetical protein